MRPKTTTNQTNRAETEVQITSKTLQAGTHKTFMAFRRQQQKKIDTLQQELADRQQLDDNRAMSLDAQTSRFRVTMIDLGAENMSRADNYPDAKYRVKVHGQGLEKMIARAEQQFSEKFNRRVRTDGWMQYEVEVKMDDEWVALEPENWWTATCQTRDGLLHKLPWSHPLQRDK